MHLTVPLLINPKAGSLFRSGLKAWLDEHRDDFTLVPTRSAEDLTARARELAEAGEPVIAAAGGDGTLMNAAQGLVGTNAALGILPCGTMNVFSRELGIGSRRFDVALDAIKNGARQEVDIFTVNDRPFLQMAGFGPDASIVKLITPKLKRNMGAAAHIVTGLKVAVRHHPVITITLPDGTEMQGTQIIMGNGKRYGGEAHLFANARYDDGKLDAAIIYQESMPILFEILGCMLQRGATSSNVSQFTNLCTFESCEISSEGTVDYQLDGDYAGTLHPGETATIRRLPQRLRVCIPRTPIPTTPIGRLMAHPMVDAWRTFLRRAQDF
ncbi:MAG: hypothetical protein IJ943_07160 [Akkermansia sp.]|nr:hypothetical protein [Akkermansia sp.]